MDLNNKEYGLVQLDNSIEDTSASSEASEKVTKQSQQKQVSKKSQKEIIDLSDLSQKSMILGNLYLARMTKKLVKDSEGNQYYISEPQFCLPTFPALLTTIPQIILVGSTVSIIIFGLSHMATVSFWKFQLLEILLVILGLYHWQGVFFGNPGISHEVFITLGLQNLVTKYDMADEEAFQKSNLQTRVREIHAKRQQQAKCKHCQIKKKALISHCGMCGVCIEETDHHCVFYGKCISETNKGHFNCVICLFVVCILYLALLMVFDNIWSRQTGNQPK